MVVEENGHTPSDQREGRKENIDNTTVGVS